MKRLKSVIFKRHSMSNTNSIDFAGSSWCGTCMLAREKNERISSADFKGHNMAVEVVYIGAAWCATCKTIKPAIEELFRKFSVPVKILDYDKDLDDEEQGAIKKVPTLRICKDGAQVAEYNVNQVASVESWLVANSAIGVSDDF